MDFYYEQSCGPRSRAVSTQVWKLCQQVGNTPLSYGPQEWCILSMVHAFQRVALRCLNGEVCG
jgi:hypothetical protein